MGLFSLQFMASPHERRLLQESHGRRIFLLMMSLLSELLYVVVVLPLNFVTHLLLPQFITLTKLSLLFPNMEDQ
jgi:hypothetical protein